MTNCLPNESMTKDLPNEIKTIADCLNELHGSNCKLILTNDGNIVVEHCDASFVTTSIDEAYDAIVLAKKYEQLFWIEDEDD